MNKPDEEDRQTQILTFSIFAPDDRNVIFKYVKEQFAPAISGLEGLYKIEVTGGAVKEYNFYYDFLKLSSYNISKNTLENLIIDQLSSHSLGNVQSNNTYIPAVIKHVKIDEILKTPLAKVNAGIIRLSDVCKVKLVEEEPKNIFRVNGQNNIRISFIPDATANQLVLAKQIKDKIQSLILPQNYRILKEYDSTEFIEEELLKNGNRFFWSILLLLLFVIVTYRSWKPIIIIMISLFINLGIVILFYYLLNIQLNLYAIAGISVSFGMIIDNIIVMYHHYNNNRNFAIVPSLITATLTTISGLIAIFFLPDIWKWSLQDFGKVIAINLLVSLFIGVIFIPSAMEYFKLVSQDKNLDPKILKSNFSNYHFKWLRWVHSHKKVCLTASILLFGIPIFMLPDKINGWDRYNNTIGSDWYKDNLKMKLEKTFGGTFRLFAQYVFTKASYRELAETKLFVNATLPLGSTLDQIDVLFRKLEVYLKQYENEIKNYTTSINSERSGRLQITFKNRNSDFPFLLQNRLQSVAIDQGEVAWSIYGIGEGFSTGKVGSLPRYRAMIKGYNKDELDRLVNAFANMLEEHPRIDSVERNANLYYDEKKQEQYNLDLNFDALADAKITPIGFSQTLENFSQSPKIIGYTEDNVTIRLIEQNKQSNDLWLLKNNYQGSSKNNYDFQKVAKLTKVSLPYTLHKEDQQYIRQLEWEYIGNDKFGKKYLETCLDKIQPVVPLGYTITDNAYGNWFKEKNIQYLLILLILGIIFIIVTIQFESLMRGIQILFIIPMSFIGIFLTFYYFDFPFDQGGYTSFLLTSGLVVNSVIFILADFDNMLKYNPQDDKLVLFYNSLINKLQPVFLTILSTVVGLIPFLIDGQDEIFWFALAAGTIGGLVFSFIYILLFLPMFIKA
jgi:multidrug efflux pump subunit AcrB